MNKRILKIKVYQKDFRMQFFRLMLFLKRKIKQNGKLGEYYLGLTTNNGNKVAKEFLTTHNFAINIKIQGNL